MSVQRRYATIVAAGWAVVFTAAAAGAGPLLLVDLKTNYLPYEDFVLVRTRVERTGDPIVRQAERVAFVGDPFLTGVRVAEFELAAAGVYHVTVDLIDGRGDLVARRLSVADVEASLAMTVLAQKVPSGSAQKTASLLVDRDGDGRVSEGDVVRYSIVLDADGGESFADVPGKAARLIPGTVATSHGVVTTGNAPDDVAVLVSDLGLRGTDPATITFDVEVRPALENQGRFFVAPVTETGRLATRLLLTDDPETDVPDDPTVTPVACSASACASDLRACQADLEELRADPDGDAVMAVLDLCPETPPGVRVDSRGCSQAQFCGRIDLDAPRGMQLCRAADWRDDEPLSERPGDCRPLAGACQPD